MPTVHNDPSLHHDRHHNTVPVRGTNRNWLWPVIGLVALILIAWFVIGSTRTTDPLVTNEVPAAAEPMQTTPPPVAPAP